MAGLTAIVISLMMVYTLLFQLNNKLDLEQIIIMDLKSQGNMDVIL